MSLLITYGIRASAGGKTKAPTLSLVTQRQSQIVVRVTNNDNDPVNFTTISYGSSTFISTDTINGNGGTRDFTITGLEINSAVSFIANVDSGKGLSGGSNTLSTSTLAQVAPTISNIIRRQTSITFTVTNNNAESSVIRGAVNNNPISSSTPSATLNAGATSNLTISGLSISTNYSLRAAAFINNISGPVASTSTSTLAQVAPTITVVSFDHESITFTLRNNNAESSVVRARLGANPISSSTPSATLNANATSGNLVFSGLAVSTTYSLRAAAFINNISGPVATTSVTTQPLLYIQATGGTAQNYTSSGVNYRSHRFLTSGTFNVTQAGNGERNLVDYAIIAGGGGGGGARIRNGAGGGGGAGGFRSTNMASGANSSPEARVTVSAQAYTITLGAGGAGQNNRGSTGSSTSAFGRVASAGGGGGNANTTGLSGGSGGGGGAVRVVISSSGTTVAGGSGVSGQGFAGRPGARQSDISSVRGGAGGSALSTLSTAGPSPGLAANTMLLNNTIETLGQGGAGATFSSEISANPGGSGGFDSNGGSAAGATGSGGGGASSLDGTNRKGGNGSGGYVVIRYVRP